MKNSRKSSEPPTSGLTDREIVQMFAEGCTIRSLTETVFAEGRPRGMTKGQAHGVVELALYNEAMRQSGFLRKKA